MLPRRLILGFALTALGCTPKIGDACLRSYDCSTLQERVCDLSYRVDDLGNETQSGRGECTIEGCGRDTCPNEAACVKIYGSDFLSVACDPAREDLATEVDGQSLPPLDDCNPNEVCLPEGLCADEISARTSCRRACKKSSDCRDGYTCVSTGARGVYVAPDLDDPANDRQAKICVPASR